MTNSNKQLLKDRLENSSRWVKDRYGNYTQTVTASSGESRTYRIKMLDLVARLESQYKDTDGKNKWSLVMSGYFKNITVTETSFKLRPTARGLKI